ncbi:MAG: polyprenyl synthetase family protein [Candidatus Bathyarchaeota archaeon]|nr:polyprenyl synthetase family protein [Candidatus Bathyarchaeota archaeon]
MEIKKGFHQRGDEALANTQKKILSQFRDDYAISQALRYFAEVTLQGALPVFPALISMSCEAVGGDGAKVTPFGEAIVLISAAADLHDDVIDQSLSKGSKQTVLGKFGVGTTILAGDILLVEGVKQLIEASRSINPHSSAKILELTNGAIFEISNAEALETRLRGRLDLTPNDVHDVIKLKAVVPELAFRIGALLGNGDSEVIDDLGNFGRIYGVNSIIIEEFLDLFDFEEFTHRIKNECLPLPVIYVLQNPEKRSILLPMLKEGALTAELHEKFVDAVLDSPEADALHHFLVSNSKVGVESLVKIKGKMREELEDLLLAPLLYFTV